MFERDSELLKFKLFYYGAKRSEALDNNDDEALIYFCNKCSMTAIALQQLEALDDFYYYDDVKEIDFDEQQFWEN